MKREKYLRLRYKWEFLRRNKEYVKTYSILGNRKPKSDTSKIINAPRRFGIVMMIDPACNFPPWEHFVQALKIQKANPEKLTKQMQEDLDDVMAFQIALKNAPVRFLAYNDNSRALLVDINGIPDVDSEEYKKILNSGHITVSIDMNAPADKIASLIKNVVFDFQRKNPLKKSFRNRDEALYKKYLRIYDLKINNPKISLDVIAKKVYPEDYDNSIGHYPDRKESKIDYDSLITRVSRELSQVKELIREGYRHIS